MRFLRLIVVFFCGVFLMSETGSAQEKLWIGFKKDSTVSSLDGALYVSCYNIDIQYVEMDRLGGESRGFDGAK